MKPERARILLIPLFAAGMLITIVAVKGQRQINTGHLPECKTEDSTNCIWHSNQHGNREGHDFINYDGRIWK